MLSNLSHPTFIMTIVYPGMELYLLFGGAKACFSEITLGILWGRKDTFAPAPFSLGGRSPPSPPRNLHPWYPVSKARNWRIWNTKAHNPLRFSDGKIAGERETLGWQGSVAACQPNADRVRHAISAMWIIRGTKLLVWTLHDFHTI